MSVKRNFLLQSIKTLRDRALFKYLYWFIRIAIGVGFIGSGLRKLPGVKFTALPVEHPVGFFFEAMFQTGFYWNTIGVIQIILGFSIFFNRSVVVTSLIMMPITFNIFLVSIALKMQGTPFITSSMLLANIFLLLCHYENYLPIIQQPRYL